MASRIPIILLLVIVLAYQCECAPSDSSVSTVDFSKICDAEWQAAMGPLLNLEFGRMLEMPHNTTRFFQCWIEYLSNWILQWLDSMEMSVVRLISNGKQGVIVKP